MSNNPYADAFKAGLKPDPVLTVSQWADKYRVLPKGGSEPGRWRTSRIPYAREIMDEMGPTSPCTDGDVIKGTQLGFTEVGNNIVLYHIHYSPCPILQVLPTETLVKRHVNSKIDPSIKAIPEVHKKIKRAKTKDDAGGTYEKQYSGGPYTLGWAQTPSTFAAFSAKVTIADDWARFPQNVGGEGNSIKLLKNRTDSFSSPKRYHNTTATNENKEPVRRYLKGSQGTYNMRCIHCKEYVVFDFDINKEEHNWIFEYDKDTYELTSEKVYFKCPHCSGLMENYHKTQMMDENNGAKFIHKHPEREHRTWRVPSFYSPVGWLSWKEIFQDYLEAKKKLDEEGDDSDMIAFVNTKLGWVYEKQLQKVASDEIMLLKNEHDERVVPPKTFLLSIAVDVQKDHFWYTVRAWQYGYNKQVIRYGRVEEWTDIEDIAYEPYYDANGAEYRIQVGIIDSGFNTEEVYDFCSMNSDIFIPVKGSTTMQDAFRVTAVEKDIDGKKIDTGIKLYVIKEDYYNDSLQNTLDNSIRVAKGESDAMKNILGLHSHTDHGITDFEKAPKSFSRQITSEYKHEEEDSKGNLKSEWRKVTTKADNHLRDCEKYQTFLGDLYGVRFMREPVAQKIQEHRQAQQHTQDLPDQEDYLSNF